MQSINSSRKLPLQFSFYYKIANNDIFQDKGFVEINNILNDKNNVSKYTYSIYTDTNLLKPNIFVPIFDTIYLASKNHYVILNNTEDFWLAEIYKNNKYFYLGQSDNKQVVSINSILEIQNAI